MSAAWNSGAASDVEKSEAGSRRIDTTPDGMVFEGAALVSD
jgi:hypothetical protein